MMVSPERQWHKRANVVAYLPKSLQEPWRRTPQAALGRCSAKLRLLSESAVTKGWRRR